MGAFIFRVYAAEIILKLFQQQKVMSIDMSLIYLYKDIILKQNIAILWSGFSREKIGNLPLFCRGIAFALSIR